MKTTRGKLLTAWRKNIIAKDTEKCYNQRSCRQKNGSPCEDFSALLGKSCTREDMEWQKCFESTSTRVRNRRRVQYNLRRKPGKTSKQIFEDYGLHGVPKTSRNRILKALGKYRSPPRNYIVTEIQGNGGPMDKKVPKACLFTDESLSLGLSGLLRAIRRLTGLHVRPIWTP